MELCGIYARDPCAPLVGPVAYELETISSVHESMELLDELKGRRGVSLARRALKYANDGSGSVMETFWYGVFCLPPRLGGSNLPRPLQNAPLEWSLDVANVVSHERMRPDFYWSQYNTACEHQGGDHARETALAEDSRRARDYELCGIHYLPHEARRPKRRGGTRHLVPAIPYHLFIRGACLQTQGRSHSERLRRSCSLQGPSRPTASATGEMGRMMPLHDGRAKKRAECAPHCSHSPQFVSVWI